MPTAPNSEPFDLSKFKFYSWGIVANNKAQSETTIQVTPIEQLTHLDGELGSIPVELEAEGQDSQGQTYTSKVTADTAIEADWLPGFGVTNRRTAPDVRRGIRVMIFTYGDTDKYYWADMGLDDHLKKLETVIYSFSGTSDEAVDGTEEGNCYSLEVSTHTGQITVKTSKKNGEHCIYAVQINAKDGNIKIVDDLDNEFVFDSKNTHIWFKNADGTLMELDKKKFHVFAPDEIHMEATESMLFETKVYKAEASESMLFETKDYKVVTDTYRLECSTGSVKGVITFEDAVTFNSATTSQGPAAFEAPITAAGITSTLPIVGPSGTI